MAEVTKVEPGSLREKVLAHIEAKRAPLVAQRDAMAAQLNKLVAEDGPGIAALRAKIKAFNESRVLYDIDQLRAAVHRDGNTKPVKGVKTLSEQLAEQFGIK